MAEPETQRQPSNPFGALFTLGGVLLQMLGLSGMADNAVEWRGFFERGVMRHYSELEGILVAGPVPPLWSAAIGYLLSCFGFFLAAGFFFGASSFGAAVDLRNMSNRSFENIAAPSSFAAA